MEKSVDAFRTISEVADELDLPQHVLRFWETRFTQIRPLKRAGGRRYYRPTDVLLLRNIRQLLYDEGYTIKGVQRLLKDKGLRGFRDEGDTDAEADDGAPEPGDERDADERASPSRAADAREVESEPAVLPGCSRVDLQEMLELVEACERILRQVLGPEAEGKRLQGDDASL